MAEHSDELTPRPALPSAVKRTKGSGLAARILRSPLAWLLLLVGGVHGFMFAREPEPHLFEDEPHYAQTAFSDAARGDTSLLPGRLRFSQRPEFGSRLLSKFVIQSDLEELWNPKFSDSLGLSARMKRLGFRKRGASLERRIRWLNLALLLALVAMTHKQARLLGMGSRAALVAAAALGLFPWFGFYVHTLWSEVLHASLLAVAFLATSIHLSSGRRLPLLLAGLALGVALLTKGALNSFLPPMGLLIFVCALWRARKLPLTRRIAHALSAPALLFTSIALLVGPQLMVNLDAGHGMRLAGNRWKNIEMGILLEPRMSQTRSDNQLREQVNVAYLKSAKTYDKREALAQERTWAHIEQTGLRLFVSEQFRKLGLILFSTPSFFERALFERWGQPAPGWLLALKAPARKMWYALLGLGCIGSLLCFRRSQSHFLLAAFVAYFAAGAFVIPYKIRFLMPVVPVLCLFAAATLESAWSRLNTLIASNE